MAVSIIGFTFFYSFPDQQQGDSGNEPPPLPGEPTEMVFYADSVSCKVRQLLPSIKIVAEPSSGDIGQVNTDVYSIQGVKRVNGRFQQSAETGSGTGFVYIADISFDRDLNSAYIVEKLAEKANLQDIDGYNFALIELPKRVSVLSQDANISRDLNLAENVSEALVGFDTIAGDEVEVSIEATFLGAKLSNLLAYETLNITAEPVAKEALVSAPIASLEERLLFTGTVFADQLAALAALEEKVKELQGVVDANVAVPQFEPTFFIDSDAELPEETFQDLNSFLHDLNAQRVSLINSPLYSSLRFQKEQEIGAIQQLLEEKLQSLSIDANVSKSSGTLFGQIALATAASKDVAAGLSALLKPVTVQVQQPALLSVSAIFDPDLNKTHELDSNTVSALLLPGHSAGEEVSVQVDYILVRGEIASINAIEK